MSLLQGINASDEQKLEQIFELISKKLGSTLPNIDYKKIVTEVSSFEKTYMLEINIVSRINIIKDNCPQLFHVLKDVKARTVSHAGDYYDQEIQPIRTVLNELKKMGTIDYSHSLNNIGPMGSSGVFQIVVDDDFVGAIARV